MEQPVTTFKFTFCPHCGKFNDAHEGLGNDKTSRPEAGDRSVCFTCGEVAVFDAGLTLRKPTLEESAEHDKHAQLRLAQALIRRRPWEDNT